MLVSLGPLLSMRASLPLGAPGRGFLFALPTRDFPFLPLLEMDETMEEKLLNEEYKIWKKNTPFLCVGALPLLPPPLRSLPRAHGWPLQL